MRVSNKRSSDVDDTQDQIKAAFDLAVIGIAIVSNEREKLLKEAQYQKALFETVMKQMPSAVIIAEAPSGKLIFANSKMNEVWRHPLIPSQNISEYNLWKGFHSNLRPYEEKDWPLTRSITHGHVISNEDTLVEFGDGTRGILRLSSSPVKDLSGKIIAGVVICQDVTEQKRAQKMLRESEERFRALADNTASCLFLLNKKGVPTYMNSAAERVTGYHLNEIKDRTIHQVLHNRRPDGSSLPIDECIIFQAQRHRILLKDKEETFLNKEGHFFPVCFSLSPLEERGEAIGSVLEFRDISAEKRAKEEQAFFGQLGKSLSSSLNYEKTLQTAAQLAVPQVADMCLIDINGEYEKLNRWVIAPQNPLFMNWEELIDQLRDVIHKTTPFQIHETPPGLSQIGYSTFLNFPLQSRGKTLGIITFVMGPSQRKFPPSAIQFASEYSTRVAMAVDNAKLYRESQEAIQTRDEFMSIASHELKTPLTVLFLQLQMLNRNLQKQIESSNPKEEPQISAAKVLNSLQLCVNQGKKLTDLLNELLDLTRIRLGRLILHKEKMELTSLVIELVDRQKIEAEKKGIVIRTTASEEIHGYWDTTRIEQVISNLISNALKYGEGKAIEISIQKDALHQLAIVKVVDHGMGIPRDLQGKIFERFERAVEGTKISGLGLGLYISRQIVECHGGNIYVESDVGKGSTFILELPLAIPDSQFQVSTA